ncbi:MAG: effector-associated domain EAD1-containing protein [Caldilineaceae bacterium]
MLNHAAFRALRNRLAGLYGTQEDARRIVADTGLDPAYIQFSDKAINNWHSILTEAEKRDSLPALLAIVLEEYGANTELVDAIQAYGVPPSPVPTQTETPPTTVYNVNTGGGHYIAGNVNTGGGDFVGRDRK